MSSNSNHINITHSNYEEYLLLYVDNELSPEQKAAVDAFLALHPDLQAELELLQSVVLPTEEITINKEDLFAERMSLNSIDESLLLYIDDELSFDEKSKLAAQIEENKITQAQYQLLLKTKLDKNEVIAYPNKEELYHHIKKRYEWLQIAAAILILLAGAWFWTHSAQNGDRPVINVANANPIEPAKVVEENTTSITSTTNTTNTTSTTPVEQTLVAVKDTGPATHHIVIASDNSAKNNVTNKIGEHTTTNNAIAAVTPAEIANNIPVQRTTTVDAVTVNNTIPKTSEHILNTSLVTSPSVVRTTYKEPVTEESNNSSGSPFKGLLRKATRFIERTTGIPTTNENNEVLIASVAVKLD
ncbi:MAG: hypothetical protein C4329_07330 [Chitinophagaceae bacterium]